MAKIKFDIEKCEPSIKEQHAKHNVDKVKFCAIDNATYTISGLHAALPDAPNPIVVVGPHNCTPEYVAAGKVGQYTGKITGTGCPEKHHALPEIIIDIGA